MHYIRDAEAYFEAERFRLAPFAAWTPEDWTHPAGDISEIVDFGLGWDITDFGLGKYHTCGLLLFTMRNDRLANLKSGVGKTYCEKTLVLDPGQHSPAHHHWIKVEDIIVRTDGRMGVEVHNAAEDGSFADTDVALSLDGVWRKVPAGTTLELCPGESITLEPDCYHKLTAPRGRVLLGEVSVVNDDVKDNRFHQPVGRFPDIQEDEPPYRLLVGDHASPATGGPFRRKRRAPPSPRDPDASDDRPHHRARERLHHRRGEIDGGRDHPAPVQAGEGGPNIQEAHAADGTPSPRASGRAVTAPRRARLPGVRARAGSRPRRAPAP